MKPNMTPRATVALGTAAVCLFLLLCFAGYGRAEALSALPPEGFSDRIASWCVGPLGVGAHLIAVLGVVWGVIVYFQERTPDLVLRLAGTATLAASAAMLLGLVNGGERSVWAGTLGTAGARALVGLGAFGTVLGWLAVLGLLGVSAVFATDWLFHTLRRGNRAAFDPRTMPTEPSRGDLLDSPGQAEPREFIRETTRATTIAAGISVPAPRAPETQPEPLPDGCSAVESGPRRHVKGPSGYKGVEFLTPSDELAIPETEPADMSARVEATFASLLEDEVTFASGSPYGRGSADPFALSLPAAQPAAPRAPAPSAFPPAPAREAAPASGIGFADDSYFVDDVLVPEGSVSYDANAGLPHDGASTVSEIAAALTSPPIEEVAEPAPEIEAPISRLPELPAAAAPVAPVAPAPAREEPAGSSGLSDDFLIGGGGAFLDDVLVFGEEPSPFATSAMEQPGTAVAAVAEAVAVEAPAETFAETLAEPEPVVEVPIEPSYGTITDVPEETPAAVAAVEEPPQAEESAPTAFDQISIEPVLADDIEIGFLDESMPEAPAPAAEWSTGEPAAPEPVAEPSAAETDAEVEAEFEVQVQEIAPPAEESVAEHPMWTEEPPVVETIAETVAEVVAEAEPVAAVYAEPVEELEPVAEVLSPEPVAVVHAEPVADVAPVVEAPAPEPVASEVIEPVAAEAPVPSPASAPAPAAASQLTLFEAPSSDLAKLRGMELDPLFADAASAILTRGRASAVVLQRTLGIGYARGLRILDQMTEAGMLGPDAPGGAREICFTRAAWDAFARGA
jgi:hypothetical protein